MLEKWPQLPKLANFAETHFNVVLEACNVTFSIACHKLGSFHMKHDLLGLYTRQCSHASHRERHEGSRRRQRVYRIDSMDGIQFEPMFALGMVSIRSTLRQRSLKASCATTFDGCLGG